MSHIVPVSSLPRTATNKVMRRVLRQQFTQINQDSKLWGSLNLSTRLATHVFTHFHVHCRSPSIWYYYNGISYLVLVFVTYASPLTLYKSFCWSLPILVLLFCVWVGCQRVKFGSDIQIRLSTLNSEFGSNPMDCKQL